MANSKTSFLLSSIVTGLLIAIIFAWSGQVGSQGFNPSDDGVILAQSWRIVNGEIPHRDFISLKPPLSGYLHTIHFYSPLPLEDSARWFVLLQNFVIVFIWVALLFRSFDMKIEGKWQFIGGFVAIAVIAFTMNLDHHGLFPWTTIDGLFWATISVALFVQIYNDRLSGIAGAAYAAAGLFFAAIASLSRQTFMFPFILLLILALLYLIHRKRITQFGVIFIAGILPYLIWFLYLNINHALRPFLSQMTGRTELFDVGFLRYVKSFMKARMVFVYLPLILFMLWFFIKNYRDIIQKGGGARKRWVESKAAEISVVLLLWILLTLSWSLHMLILNDPMNQANPFELFWLMLTVVLFAFIFLPLQAKQKGLLLLGMFLCWTTSLSLGMNSPVYCLGIIVSTTLVIIIYILNVIPTSHLREQINRWGQIVAIPLAILIFTLGLYTQRHFNYRDKASDALTCNLGTLMPQMGSTRTNANLCDYYSEFLKIYKAIPEMKDHFVLLPNNAIIYPALRSKNPFPVDWMQHDEYIGHENQVMSGLKEILMHNRIYVLLDIYNSELIAYRLIPFQFVTTPESSRNDLFVKKYKVQKYDYMPLIIQNCREIPVNYKYFRLFISSAPTDTLFQPAFRLQ